MNQRRLAFAALAVLVLLAGSLLASCSDEGITRSGPCYTVEELYSAGAAVSDSSGARTSFDGYVNHLEETGTSPPFGAAHLEYVRADGLEFYKRHLYWGIVARAISTAGDTTQARMFRVREDGTVVLMLGCI